MFFRMMLFVWQFVLDLAAVMRMAGDEKDLEIMVLLGLEPTPPEEQIRYRNVLGGIVRDYYREAV